MRIGQRHEHVVAIFQVNVILIAEMFDAVDAPRKLSATGLGDLQVFGADAERFGAGGHGGMREKVNRQEIDRRCAEPARDITVGGGLV